MKTKLVMLALVAAMSMSGYGVAGEAEDKAAGIGCNPAKRLVSALGKLSKAKPGQKNSAVVTPSLKIIATDGGVLPERFFYRNEGVETAFILNEFGVVTDIAKIKTMPKAGEMCIQDMTRRDKPEGEKGLSIQFEMGFSYINNSGVHSALELQDGLDDIRSQIKKMAPLIARPLVPKLTHMVVFPEGNSEDEEGVDLDIRAQKDGEILPARVARDFGNGYIVEMAHLKKLGADQLHITGGTYKLSPMFKPRQEDGEQSTEKAEK